MQSKFIPTCEPLIYGNELKYMTKNNHSEIVNELTLMSPCKLSFNSWYAVATCKETE